MSEKDSKQIATLESVITARIAPIIGEMIPEEMLRERVKAITNDFMIMTLPMLIRAELNERCKKLIADQLNSPEWKDFWNYKDTNGQGRLDIGPKMAEIVKQLIPDIVEAAMRQPFAMLLQNMRNNLQQLGRY